MRPVMAKYHTFIKLALNYSFTTSKKRQTKFKSEEKHGEDGVVFICDFVVHLVSNCLMAGINGALTIYYSILYSGFS